MVQSLQVGGLWASVFVVTELSVNSLILLNNKNKVFDGDGINILIKFIPLKERSTLKNKIHLRIFSVM